MQIYNVPANNHGQAFMPYERGFFKMTFEQAFLKIKEKFENADASSTQDFAIQVTFSDEDCGGTFYAEVKNGKLAVEPYDYRDSDVILDIKKSALLAVLSGRSSLDKAVANGEAVVQGDASKIADWKNTIKKAPAKKATEKEKTVEKAVKSEPVKPAVKAAETKPVTKTVDTTSKAAVVKADTTQKTTTKTNSVNKATTKTVAKSKKTK